MPTHDTEPARPQSQVSQPKAGSVPPQIAIVAPPSQVVPASPTNPFPRRPHETWVMEPSPNTSSSPIQAKMAVSSTLGVELGTFNLRPPEKTAIAPSSVRTDDAQATANETTGNETTGSVLWLNHAPPTSSGELLPGAGTSPVVQTKPDHTVDHTVNDAEVDGIGDGLSLPFSLYPPNMPSRRPKSVGMGWRRGIPLIQAKLTVGQPNDRYEQEADRVAAQVVEQIHTPGAGQSVATSGQAAVQREAASDEHDKLQMKPVALVQRIGAEENDDIQMKPMVDGLQRQVDPDDEDELQMKPIDLLQRESMEEKLQRAPVGDEDEAVSADLEGEINAARGGGQSLAPELQEQMGAAMGADFSGVRVHTNAQADQLNQSIQAKAFTTGSDVFFRQGAYEPGSRGGQELIAHELTHVVQQNAAQPQTVHRLHHRDARTDLYSRLPSLQTSLASASALGQPVEVVQRSDKRRIHRCGGSGSKKTSKKETSQKETPQKETPKQVEALGANEIILSSDPAYAQDSFLGWFRNKIKDKVETWNLTFDPNAIQCKSVLLNDVATPAITLTWNPEWGDKPTSTDIPFSMQPVEARVAVAAVKKLAGWSKLPKEDQAMLENMLKGESNNVSASARKKLQGMLTTLASQPDVEQAKALSGLISAKESLPSVVNEPVTTVAIKYELEGPATEKDYQFRGKKADAEKWTVKFADGISLTIIAPKAPEKGYHNHTVEKAAESASYLPKSNRSAITTILLNVVVNPDDAHWAAEYKTPDFHSYMTAGKSGIVTIYPNPEAKPLPSDNYMRGTMIHETGHTWSYKTWGTDTKAGKWVDWKQAMDKDKASVSGYAMASIDEDVAETIQVYTSTQGSPRFAEYQQIVPNRFQILDAEYK